MSQDILIWDYNIQFANPVSPFPNLHTIGPNIKFYIQNNVGALFMQATGTLALDIDLQPLAAMSARFQGFFPAIERLKAARVIRSRDAALAKVVLGVLSRRATGSDLATVSLPLNIQNGVLTAQQVKLMDISPIVWPDPKDQS